MQYFVRSGALASFPELVSEYGQDPIRLMRNAGISPGVMHDPDLYIPYLAEAQLLELAAESCQAPDFGIQMAARQGIEIAGALGTVASLQADLGSAMLLLQQNIRFHAHGVHIGFTPTPAGVELSMQFQFARPGEFPQLHALSVGVFCRAVNQLHAETLFPLSVDIAIDSRLLTPSYEQILNCPVNADASANRILYSPDMAELPVILTDNVRHNVNTLWRRDISRVQQTASLQQQVERAITALLPTGECQLAMVSHTIGLHPRVLQRRLKAEGSSFGEILANVRQRLACHYLENSDMGITELAMNLGFRDAAAFSNAFRKWTGQAPRARRQSATLRPSNPALQ